MRRTLSLACNAFVFVMTIVAWLMMTMEWSVDPDAPLSTAGLANLKYFTVLSNLFSGLVSGACAVVLARAGRTGRLPSRVLVILKVMSTTAVTVTFFTVVVLFCIIFGVPGMFGGANFWFHLVLPLVSIVEFCAIDDWAVVRLRTSAAGIVPTVAYGIPYYANILLNGVGEWPNGNDWYGFCAWGVDKTPIVFTVMVVGTWLLAALLVFANRLMAGRGAARRRKSDIG